jgi:hypothetical protein
MQVSELVQQLDEFAALGSEYLRSLEPLVEPVDTAPWRIHPNKYWDQIPESHQLQADDLESRFLPLAKAAVHICKHSALVDQADIRDLQVAVKSARSALHLRRYLFSDGEAIHDEGTVLGFSPPSQEERALTASEAPSVLRQGVATIRRILDLIDDRDNNIPPLETGSTKTAYRRDTAFIMMWMDPNEPALEDIRDAMREVFASFGIKAVRADDVEHEGMITERIINEIRTSEFLLADLTGARPSVYYEVGYAHALGKRVILYRKEGTQIHFDLAGYNCPEYRNIRDLREKLTRRLEQLTNRKPQ